MGKGRCRQEPGRSAGDLRKADGWIIAQGRGGFQRHVAVALDGPLIVLFEQDRSDEADDRTASRHLDIRLLRVGPRFDTRLFRLCSGRAFLG